MNTRNFHAMILLVLAAAVWTGCAKQTPEEPARQANSGTVRFTATLAGKGGETTKALSADGTAAWVEGEEIAVYYQKSDDTFDTATATVQSVGSSGAVITATLTDAADGTEATLVYPASLHNGAGELDTDQLYNVQYGNLTGDNGISTRFDAAIGTGTLSVNGETAALAGKVKLENQLCICTFVLNSVGADSSAGEDPDTQSYSGKTFRIKCEDDTQYTITSDRSDAGATAIRGFRTSDKLYVAMLPYSGSLTCELSDEENGLTFSSTTGSGTLKAGKFYSNIPLDLLKVSAPVPLTGDFQVDVDEAALSNGNAYGEMGTATAAVTIEGYDIVEGGSGTYGRIAKNEGSDGWVYTLEKAFTDDTTDQDSRNIVQKADEVTVSVTDNAGNSYSALVHVNIRDDIPVIAAESKLFPEGWSRTGSISFSYGADVPDASTLAVSNGTLVETGEHAGWYETTCGWVKLSTFGTSYTYEAKSGTAGKSESVIFTVTDVDGDQTSATATVTVIMPKSLDIKKKYGWSADEAALSGGNAYSEKGSNDIFLYDTNQEFIILEGGKGKYGEINDLISEWYYYLKKPYTDDTEGQDGRNLVLAADEVLVTTADADNPYLVILIPIKDDIPVISAEDASLSGQSTTGSFSFNYGADVPAASTLTVSNGTLLKTGAYAGWYEMTYGLVKLAEDGKSYTYQTISLTTETTETIIFTVTDADGDKASATAKVKIPAQTAENGTNEGGDPSDPVEIGGNTGGGVSGELSPVSVDVDEAALSGGNAYGGMGSTRAAVAVKGYDILEGGEGNYGNIAYDDASGEWMYSLTKSYQDTTEGQDGRNVVPAADNVTVTVRDGAQKRYSATVRINIRDDIPAISAGNVSISEELAITGTLAINYGADVPDASTLVVSNGTRVESGEHAGWYETTCLWVKLGDDGKSYTYEAKPGTAGNEDTVTFAITDADGDQATATVTVTIGE